jgi:hypothetical protein
VLRQIIAVISSGAFFGNQNRAPKGRMQENMIISDHDPKVQGATSIAGIDALLARIGGGLRHRGLRVACVCEA